MDIAELKSKLKEFVAGLQGVTAKQFVQALKEEQQPFFQEAFNAGHSAATNDLKSKLDAKDNELTEARTKITQLESQQPDVAKLHTDYQKQISDLKSTHTTELEKVNGTLVGERKQRAVSDLKTKMLERGLNAKYVDVEARSLEGRMTFGDDGAVVVHQKGTQIPLQASGEKTVLDLLADEAYEAADPVWKTSKADQGSGVQPGNGGASGLTTDQLVERKASSGQYAL